MSNLKKNYKTPDVPEGFDDLCVFIYLDGGTVLDFVNHEHGIFASENQELNLEWPWVQGFKPSPDDWVGAGFKVISEQEEGRTGLDMQRVTE